MRRMYTQEQIVGIVEKSNLFAKKLYRHHVLLSNSDFHLECDVITENSNSFTKTLFATYMTSRALHVLSTGIYVDEETPLLITELYYMFPVFKINAIKLDGTSLNAKTFSFENLNSIAIFDFVSEV